MIYTEEFKKKFMTFFDELEEHERKKSSFDKDWYDSLRAYYIRQMDAGDDKNIGLQLKSASEYVFYAEDIMAAYWDKSVLNELYFEARKSITAKGLYEEWKKMQIDYELTHDDFVVGTPKTR